jgi:SAM-dependent methyltransferase
MGAMAFWQRKARAARFWDKAVGRHREPFAHWESPAPIQRRLNWIVSGSENIDPVRWFLNEYGPFARVADLGCGDGVLTATLIPRAPGTRIDAYDISPASLRIARERCGNAANVAFHEFDLNAETLPRDTYDAVFATGTMHHVEKLDFCMASIRDALKPRGLLWLNDYVGPARYQWSDTQMRLANELLSLVPDKWRTRNPVRRFPPARIERMDPSEAVASHAIEDSLLAHFEVIRKVARGGTLLAPIFGSGCLDSGMAESEEGLSLLRRLYETERKLIAAGVIKSDNFLYVARRRLGQGLVRDAFRSVADEISSGAPRDRRPPRPGRSPPDP